MNETKTIEEQLRQYAEAIDPALTDTSGVIKRRGPSVNATWLAAAAAAVILVLVAGAGRLQRDTVQTVDVGAFAQESQDSSTDETVLQVEPAPVVEPMRLLPDSTRWVVVEDWSARPGGALQLDFAPLDGFGVPQLGRRISVRYQLGPVEDFDRQWGDTSAMGEPVEFAFSDGLGRSVHNEQAGFAAAQVWSDGTFLYIQTQDPRVDLTEFAQSMVEVDETSWSAAQQGAADHRLLAVQAAMDDIEPVPASGEPLPHWVLPAPWQLDWVTDKTIWTPEQHAQSAALSEANRTPGEPSHRTTDVQTWTYGFAETEEDAAGQFVPQIQLSVAVFDDAPTPMPPLNFETISALGLKGVISPVGRAGVLADLGTGAVRVSVQTTSGFGADGVREFLDAIEFASEDPLDGFLVSDPRFQPIELPNRDESSSGSWHAAWQQPDGPGANISVWRLSVAELRIWVQGRGNGSAVPDDVWEIIAADEVIDLDSGTTYDVSTGLLISLDGIAQDDLIPIELEDWIALVEPVNTDPLKPR